MKHHHHQKCCEQTCWEYCVWRWCAKQKGDCNWAEGCHCTVDNPPSACNQKPGGQGPPNAVGAHAFGPIVGSGGSSGTGRATTNASSRPTSSTRWDGILQLQLVNLTAGVYNLSAPQTSPKHGGSSSAAAAAQMHFAHREEPKLLWSWSEARGEYVPSHLFNVVEAGGPTTLNWKHADSWIHAQPLRLP
eukprot:COSAG06_NODE_305_length_17809_cov_6.221796_17_plen_189_part_00